MPYEFILLRQQVLHIHPDLHTSQGFPQKSQSVQLTIERQPHVPVTTHFGAVIVLIVGPSLAHSLSMERDIHPGILPPQGNTARVQRDIGYLIAIIFGRAVGMVHHVLVAIRPLQRELLPRSHLPGATQRGIRANDINPCQVHSTPNEHIVRNAHNLVGHPIAVAVQRCLKIPSPVTQGFAVPPISRRSFFPRKPDIQLSGFLRLQI